MKKILLVSLLALVIASCAGATPAPSPTPVAQDTPTVTMTVTPSPTATITPTSTITPSPTPEVFVPPVVTQEQFGQISEKNYKDFFTPMTQAQFEELHAWMTTPENKAYTGTADPVGIGTMSEGPSGKKLAIYGTLGVNEFPLYLVNVDGEFRLIIQVVVEKEGVKVLLPVTFEVFNAPKYIDNNVQGKYMERIFEFLGYNDRLRYFIFFVGTDDGISSVEENILSYIIDENTGLEPLSIIGISEP